MRNLAELNSYVRVTALEKAELEEADLAAFNVVVFTNNFPRDTLLRFNEFCRTQNPAIGFIISDVRGTTGRAFVDFGPEHTVFDPDGEQTRSVAVMDVEKGAERTIIQCDDGKRHGFSEGEHVIFHDVQGMTELNDNGPFRIVATQPYAFEIEADSSSWGDFLLGSAVAEQTKVPTKVAFESLAVRRHRPVPKDDPMGDLITVDFSKFGRPKQLHVAYEALDEFQARHGRLPAPNNDEEAQEVVTLAQEIMRQAAERVAADEAYGGAFPEELEEDVVRKAARHAALELAPVCAFFGGVVAQEVVKFTGKFSPIRQYLYTDAFEVYPTEAPSAEDVAPRGDRYDHVTQMLGRPLLERVRSSKVFVVGAGALGCEFLKNYCLLGAGCGPEGRLTVTDMDNIEVSNLNRQFLFRPKDVGSAKSVTAAAAAQRMNPELQVEALETPVGPDTEDVFDDTFWEGLDVVTNALDNVKARLYVDGQCVFHRKPLLESGTLGTKGNTQTVAPFKTESYGDKVDPPEESIPLCTLKNFPHQIEHCIEWARDLFEGSFTTAVQDAKKFSENPQQWLDSVREEPNLHSRRMKLEGVTEAVEASRSASFESCVQAAARIFHDHFNMKIRQLLHNFPKDYKNERTGAPFWSGTKRAPDPEELDVENNEIHRSFIAHAAALLCTNFGVPVPEGYDTVEVLKPIVDRTHLPEFVPKSVRIKENENDETEEGEDDDDRACAELERRLQEVAEDAALSKLAFNPAEFEKDDDSNHHIDFIAGASNLRALNYKIPTASRHKVKMIAGRIIPAIATTTCMITGLVCLEYLKVLQDKPIEALRNTFVNLAVNVYAASEPGEPKRTKSVDMDPVMLMPVRAKPEGFTPWDRIIIHGLGADVTVRQFCEHFRETQGLDVDMISHGSAMLYAPTFYRSHAERADKPLRRVFEEVTKRALDRRYVVLDVACRDPADRMDVMVPRTQIYFD